MERWKPIPDHPGYEVSDHGRVRSLTRLIQVKTFTRQLQGRLLKTQFFPNGYVFIRMGQGRAHLVHRLVARAFVRGYVETLDVNHGDGNRANNFYKNLEWMTRSGNVTHSYRVLGRKQHAKTTAVIVGGVKHPSELSASQAIGRAVGSLHSALVRGHLCAGMEVRYG